MKLAPAPAPAKHFSVNLLSPTPVEAPHGAGRMRRLVLRDAKVQAIALVLAVLLFWLAWSNRYEPIPSADDRRPWVLDRWTGRICTVSQGKVVCLAKASSRN